MTSSDTSARYAAALVGGFADAGITTAFVSPGSRNTPITLALANEPRIEDISIRDERSAGFIAVGYAKASGTPAIVSCTSGSAATHYFPAIVEADQSMTPMIILTADRPLRLRGSSAPQTMDQVELYGSHVTMFVDLDAGRPGSARSDALDLVRRATREPHGPVHANMPFDEPLLPHDDVSVAVEDRIDITTRDGDETPTAPLPSLSGRSVLIVAGGRATPDLAAAIVDVSHRLSAPVFADPQVNVTGSHVLRNGDLIVSATQNDGSGALETHPPDVVLRIGPIPTSKVLWRWLETSGIEQILIDESRLSDPLDSATTTVAGDIPTILRSITRDTPTDEHFLEAWLAMDRVTEQALEDQISRLPFPNEPAIARTAAARLPTGTIFMVASSRPIRDIDAFAAPRRDIRILANRGLNGIDGLIATSLGAALAGQPTALLVGDVAALHDIGSLTEVARFGVPLRIIVVNNNGGGIFSFLPQATSPLVGHRTFERHWGTPHGLRITPIAAAMGMPSTEVTSLDEFTERMTTPITGPELIEVVTDRNTNVEHHSAIHTAIRRVLSSARSE